MLKNERGNIEGHQGIELVDSCMLVDDIMRQIMPQLNQFLVLTYQKKLNLAQKNLKIFASFDNEKKYIYELKVISDYLRDVFSDITTSSLSEPIRNARVTQIEAAIQKIRKIHFKYIDIINNRISNNNYDIGFQYSMIRTSYSLYCLSCIVEYIIAGLLDNENLLILKDKVRKELNEINSITEKIKDIVRKQKGKVEHHLYFENNRWIWDWGDYYMNKINKDNLYNQETVLKNTESRLEFIDIDDELKSIDKLREIATEKIKYIAVYPDNK